MKHKILIVEDNEPIRENTTELLELYQYDVMSACNGKEGLNIALLYKPDLILCDIMMPVMSGYHLLELVRNEPLLKDCRFIFFTASAEKNEIETGYKLGAHDYIIKPFSGDELLSKLKKQLDEKGIPSS